MTQPGGVFDLSTLKHDPAAETARAGGTVSRYQIEFSEQTLQQVISGSAQVPVLVAVVSERAQGAGDFAADLGTVVDDAAGRLQLAVVDADREPRIAQALQVQQVPTTYLIVGGQIQPLFSGAVPAQELRGLIGQVLQAAASAGVAGTAQPTTAGAADEDAEPPLPPQHQAAFDAIERGDLAGARAAYEQALEEAPADEDATIGLATVALMERTQDADADAVRRRAADDPTDLEAQFAVADLDVLGGHVEDAFARLIDVVKRRDPEATPAARERLLELFAVVGAQDERVVTARRRLASALY